MRWRSCRRRLGPSLLGGEEMLLSGLLLGVLLLQDLLLLLHLSRCKLAILRSHLLLCIDLPAVDLNRSTLSVDVVLADTLTVLRYHWPLMDRDLLTRLSSHAQCSLRLDLAVPDRCL